MKLIKISNLQPLCTSHPSHLSPLIHWNIIAPPFPPPVSHFHLTHCLSSHSLWFLRVLFPPETLFRPSWWDPPRTSVCFIPSNCGSFHSVSVFCQPLLLVLSSFYQKRVAYFPAHIFPISFPSPFLSGPIHSCSHSSDLHHYFTLPLVDC